MKEKEKNIEIENRQEAEPEVAPDTVTEDVADEEETATPPKLTPEQKIEQLEQEVEKSKNEYLFLMAEFDNYRKRTLKEKNELVKNAAEGALRSLLPVVDDFERALDAIPDDADESTRDGVTLIYKKLVKYLDDNHVKAMDTNNALFDADLHEAVTLFPAQSEDMKGRVIDTVMKGYMINDKVLRHAKVVVGQ